MHDAHFGRAFLFLDILAEYTLLSMTVMVTPCLLYVVGMKLVTSHVKFRQASFARAPFGECRVDSACADRPGFRSGVLLVPWLPNLVHEPQKIVLMG